jgi:protein-disulfide isomerase
MSGEENEEEKEEMKEHKKDVTERLRGNPWILSTFVLGVFVVVLLIGSLGGFSLTGNAISSDEAGNIVISALEQQGASGLTVDSVKETSGVYEVDLLYQGQNIPFYITKDGKYVGQLSSLVSDSEDNPQSDAETQDIPKTDKPKVELFVMSYCPYGTQAEKGILPVVNLLKDKIDFNLRFVYYAMHPTSGEVEENLRQYCIQKEQKSKFNAYLECFLEEGKSSDCLKETGIDMAKLNLCYAKTDKDYEILKNKNDTSLWMSGRYPLFNIDKGLNEQYKVAGSPTLVINGVQASSERSPSAYLDIVCQAFTDGNVPEECGTSLPTESYVPMWGWTLSSGTATNGAQCV